MKKKLIRIILTGTMIAAMTFGFAACGTEQTTVAETPAVTAAAPAAEETADAAKETPAVSEKETEAKATEAAAPAETETEEATERSTEAETEKEAAATDGSPLIGKWTLEMFEFQFNEDGTGDYLIMGTSMPFTYEDHGDSVYVKFDEDSNGDEHKYRIEGDTLYFEDSMGEEVAYTR